MESSPCSRQLEKARAQHWRPSAVKNKNKFLKIVKMLYELTNSKQVVDNLKCLGI